jgi:uncharacterized protein
MKNNQSKINPRRAVLVAALSPLLMSNHVWAQDKTTIVLGTATPGGGFPVYGAAFAQIVNQTDARLDVQPRNTRGSTENIPLIEAGQLDIALVTGEPLYEAVNGIGRTKADLKIITAMYASPGMFVTKGDSAARTIADLLGKPVAFGAKGSGLVILARYVLDGLGYDMERDFKAVYLDRAGDGPAMVEDGRVAALWGGGIGWPGFTAIAKSSAGARFIAPNGEQIQKIVQKHGLLKPMTVAANSYPGQVDAIPSVGSWSFVIARPTLPDETAYRLARALHLGEAGFAAFGTLLKETTAANTAAAAPSVNLIHAGAQRYIREAGFLR